MNHHSSSQGWVGIEPTRLRQNHCQPSPLTLGRVSAKAPVDARVNLRLSPDMT